MVDELTSLGAHSGGQALQRLEVGARADGLLQKIQGDCIGAVRQRGRLCLCTDGRLSRCLPRAERSVDGYEGHFDPSGGKKARTSQTQNLLIIAS